MSNKFKQALEALKPFAEMFEELTESQIQRKGPLYACNGVVISVDDIHTAFLAYKGLKAFIEESKDDEIEYWKIKCNDAQNQWIELKQRKRITVALLRDLLQQHHNEEITFSRMVEILNGDKEDDGPEASNTDSASVASHSSGSSNSIEERDRDNAAMFLEELNISGDTMVNLNHGEHKGGAVYLHDILAVYKENSSTTASNQIEYDKDDGYFWLNGTPYTESEIIEVIKLRKPYLHNPSDPEFLKYVDETRKDFCNKANDDWWMRIGVERVVFEDMLIAYDQMRARLESGESQ